MTKHSHRQENKTTALKSHVWFKWDQDKGRKVIIEGKAVPVGMPRLVKRLGKGDYEFSRVYEMTVRTFTGLYPEVKLRGGLTHARDGVSGT